MTDERNKRPDTRSDTPVGVAALIEYGDTGVHDVIEDPAAADDRLRRRIKETSQAVVETSQIVADTSSRVDEANVGITTLRLETRKHIDEIKTTVEGMRDGFTAHLTAQDTKIATLDTKIGGVGSKVDNLLPKLIDALADDRRANRADEHLRLSAAADVDTHKQKAAIDDAQEGKSFKRNAALKGLGLIGSGGALWAFLSHLTC